MNAVSILRIILCILLCMAAGWIGSLATRDAIPQWYAGLNKPAFSPPNWAFGVVWPILYVLMGIALAMILSEGFGRPEVRIAAAVFGIQLVLNAAWSLIFFGLHRIDWALVEIVVLWLAILATAYLFSRVSKGAAALLVPYLLWVSFAIALNAGFWRLNLP
jgi:benzodiazapine receptor